MAIGIGIGIIFALGTPAAPTPLFGSGAMVSTSAAAGSATAIDWFVASGALRRYRSDLGVTLVGSDVSALADQSGNGNDLAAAANRPNIDTGGAIDKIVFTKAQVEHLDGAAFAPPAAYTFSLIGATRALSTNSILVDGDSSSSWFMDLSATEWRLQQGAELLLHPDGDTALHHWDAGWDGANVRLRVDGGAFSIAAKATVGGDGLGEFTLGAGNGYFGSDLDFYEFVFWPTALGATDLAVMRAYVTARYGV